MEGEPMCRIRHLRRSLGGQSLRMASTPSRGLEYPLDGFFFRRAES